MCECELPGERAFRSDSAPVKVTLSSPSTKSKLPTLGRRAGRVGGALDRHVEFDPAIARLHTRARPVVQICLRGVLGEGREATIRPINVLAGEHGERQNCRKSQANVHRGKIIS